MIFINTVKCYTIYKQLQSELYKSTRMLISVIFHTVLLLSLVIPKDCLYISLIITLVINKNTFALS